MHNLEVPEKAASLFGAAHYDGNLLILSCLHGVMGKVYADTVCSPQTAAAVIGDFTFFAGRVSHKAVAFRPKESKNDYRILIPQNRAWEEAIEAVYRGKYRKIERFATKKNPRAFDRDKLERIFSDFSRLSQRFEIVEITSQLYGQCLEMPWSRDLVSNYGSFAEFKKQGLGFVILDKGKIVSGASSYAACGDCIEIEIDTEKSHRRKGLAAACGARLIYECLERGIYPSWDAHNRESARLAQKLGYEISHSYTAYEI